MKDAKPQLSYEVFGVSRKAPIIGIYGETGRFPQAIEAIVNAAKCWHRLQDMKNTTVVHKAYTEMKYMNSGHRHTIIISESKHRSYTITISHG